MWRSTQRRRVSLPPSHPAALAKAEFPGENATSYTPTVQPPQAIAKSPCNGSILLCDTDWLLSLYLTPRRRRRRPQKLLPGRWLQAIQHTGMLSLFRSFLNLPVWQKNWKKCFYFSYLSPYSYKNSNISRVTLHSIYEKFLW